MAGGMQNRRAGDMGSNESALQVGLIPLIDLSLTLVVVFLIFMPMSMVSIIPISSGQGAASSGRATPSPDAPIVLEIGPERVRMGQVDFRTELSLIAWLRDASAARQEKTLTVRALPDVTQERLVQVLDWVRVSGEWKVTLLTVKDEGRP